jgi:PEP-CTERM motif
MKTTVTHTNRSECFAEDLSCLAPTPKPRGLQRQAWLRGALLSSAAVAAIGLAGPARADNIVSYVYAGVVDDDEAGRGWISFTGQITFYRFAVDLIADPNIADYKMSNSPSGNWPNGMNVTFNTGESVSFNNYFDILVTNNVGGTDQFGAQAHDAGSPDSLGITLWDFSQTVFASDALPLPAGGLTLAPFAMSAFKYESAGGLLSGHLTGLTCVVGCDALPAVPEPQTWALLLAGLSALGAVARRRQRPA